MLAGGVRWRGARLAGGYAAAVSPAAVAVSASPTASGAVPTAVAAPSSTTSPTATAQPGRPVSSPSPAASASPAPDAQAGGTRVRLVGITDFHGHIARVEGKDEDGRVAVSEPGAVALACEVAKVRSQDPSTLFVSAGDNVGGSAYVSSILRDEPTMTVLNQIGLVASAAGNHEFDQGVSDLAGRVIAKLDAPVLSANVTGNAALTAEGDGDGVVVKDVDGVKVGFVGVTTDELPTLTSAAGLKGLTIANATEPYGVAATVADAQRKAEAYQVQPFGNEIAYATYTGKQVKQVLAEQFQPTTSREALILGVSSNVQVVLDQQAADTLEQAWDQIKNQGVDAATLEGQVKDAAASVEAVVAMADGSRQTLMVGDVDRSVTAGLPETGRVTLAVSAPQGAATQPCAGGSGQCAVVRLVVVGADGSRSELPQSVELAAAGADGAAGAGAVGEDGQAVGAAGTAGTPSASALARTGASLAGLVLASGLTAAGIVLLARRRA